MKMKIFILSVLPIAVSSLYVSLQAEAHKLQPSKRAYYFRCRPVQQQVLGNALQILTHVLELGKNATAPQAREDENQYVRRRLDYHFNSPKVYNIRIIHYRFSELYYESRITPAQERWGTLAIRCVDTDNRCGGRSAYVGQTGRYVVVVRRSSFSCLKCTSHARRIGPHSGPFKPT